jgi:exopolysaccharide biosynthesis polyprenyl glycosylphosphotransferase
MKPSVPEVSTPLARKAVATDASPVASTQGLSHPGYRRRAVAQAASRLHGDVWGPFDAAAAAVSVLLAHWLSPMFQGVLIGRQTLRIAALQAIFLVLIAYAVGLYDWNVLTRRGLILRRGVVAVSSATVATLAFHYFVFYEPIGRWITVFSFALTAVLVLAPRYAVWRVLQLRPRRLLFVGESPFVTATVLSIEKDLHRAYEVVGSWRSAAEGDLVEACQSLDVDEIVLPLEASSDPDLMPSVLRCLPLGCQVRSVADFHEDAFRSVPVAHVSSDWLLSGGLDTSNHLGDVVKRTSDAVFALVLLIVSLPVTLLTALLIALQRDGPVFYTQLRLGRHERLFRILKFRTMRTDAEAGEAQWASGDDPRVTRLGRLLRRSRIDELPQLANILLGHMSFVGPRPERPEFAARLEEAIPFYAWRHMVRPGLTGWAQINYPYGASIEDTRRKLEFDLYYIRHFSLLTDAVIVLRTMTAALHGGR